MWFEIGMRYIDGLPYYPIFDVMLVVFGLLMVATIVLVNAYRKQKEQIEELQNLVDYYYYNENLIK